jgi:phage terminase large subunit-like protein
LIDDGRDAKDPTIVCHLYEVPEDVEDIFDPAVWRLANPALGTFRSFDDLKSIADKARRMPAEEPKFRNLYLNQRVAPVSS